MEISLEYLEGEFILLRDNSEKRGFFYDRLGRVVPINMDWMKHKEDGKTYVAFRNIDEADLVVSDLGIGRKLTQKEAEEAIKLQLGNDSKTLQQITDIFYKRYSEVKSPDSNKYIERMKYLEHAVARGQKARGWISGSTGTTKIYRMEDLLIKDSLIK